MVSIEEVSPQDQGTEPGGARPLGQTRAEVAQPGPNQHTIHGPGGGGSDEEINENQELQQSYESLGSPIESKLSETDEVNENLNETSNSLKSCVSNDPYEKQNPSNSKHPDATNDLLGNRVLSDPYGGPVTTTHDDHTTDEPGSGSRLDTTDGGFSTPANDGAARHRQDKALGSSKLEGVVTSATGTSVASTVIYDETVAQHLGDPEDGRQATRQQEPQGTQQVASEPSSSMPQAADAGRSS